MQRSDQARGREEGGPWSGSAQLQRPASAAPLPPSVLLSPAARSRPAPRPAVVCFLSWGACRGQGGPHRWRGKRTRPALRCAAAAAVLSCPVLSCPVLSASAGRCCPAHPEESTVWVLRPSPEACVEALASNAAAYLRYAFAVLVPTPLRCVVDPVFRVGQSIFPHCFHLSTISARLQRVRLRVVSDSKPQPSGCQHPFHSPALPMHEGHRSTSTREAETSERRRQAALTR